MKTLKFTQDHEWLRVENDGTVTVGITDYAQQKLGDVVYVELPEVGKQITKDEDAAVVESVKAANDIKMPIAGTIIAINEQLSDEPEKVNIAPVGEGWFLKIKPSDPKEVDEHMDEAAYQNYIDDL